MSIAVSDKGGHFSIDRLPPGKYLLTLERSGFIKQAYGQRSADHAGAILVLRAGQDMDDLIFRLQPTGVISGTVTDEDGEPLPHATVRAFTVTSVQGKTELKGGGSYSTNDLGEYRIFDLAPGHYFICASFEALTPTVKSHVNPFDGRIQQLEGAYTPMYYPGVPRRDVASAITVKAGDEIPAIDVVLSPVQTYKVRGRAVVAAVDGKTHNVMINVLTRGNETGGEFVRSIEPDSATGKFEILGVAPGAYSFEAFSARSDGGGPYTASQPIDVVGSDVDGVSLTLRTGIAISGQIHVEDSENVNMSKAEVILTKKGSVIDETYTAQAKVDGSLTFTGVHDGWYSVDVKSDCHRCYLKSATSHGINLVTEGLHVDSDSNLEAIQLVYSSDSGTVEGSVQGDDQLPGIGVVVDLIPVGSSRKIPSRFKRTTTNQYGRFQIEGIAPDSYTIFAWETPDEANTGELDFIMSGKGSGESVDVNPGQRKSIQLTISKP